MILLVLFAGGVVAYTVIDAHTFGSADADPGADASAAGNMTLVDRMQPREATDSTPPGLHLDDGITDADRLAAAHAHAVGNASYTWTITVRLTRNGTRTLRREEIRVGGPRTYATGVVRRGNASVETVFVADSELYANGSVAWVNRGTDQCRRPVRGSDQFTVRAERYLGWLLSVDESWIFARFQRNDTTYYSVQLQGDPWPGIRNASGSVLLDARGRVHALRRVGDLPDGGHVAVTLQYGQFGNTSVSAPGWYDETAGSGDCD